MTATAGNRLDPVPRFHLAGVRGLRKINAERIDG
jgi:hypothetical protein